MPLLLVLALVAAGSVLAITAVYYALNANFAWDYLIVAFNVVAISLFALLHRRNPTVADWVQWIALFAGLIGLYGAVTTEPLEPMHFVLDVLPYVESVLLLGLFLVLKLPASRNYLASGTSPDTSLERTRDG